MIKIKEEYISKPLAEAKSVLGGTSWQELHQRGIRVLVSKLEVREMRLFYRNLKVAVFIPDRKLKLETEKYHLTDCLIFQKLSKESPKVFIKDKNSFTKESKELKICYNCLSRLIFNQEFFNLKERQKGKLLLMHETFDLEEYLL